MNKTQIIYENNDVPFLIGLHSSENKVWGIQIDGTAVFCLDIENEMMQYAGKIPDIGIQAEKAFHSVVQHKNLRFFIPFWETSLVIYNDETKGWKKVDLELHDELKPKESVRQQEISGNMPGFFYGGCIYRDSVVLFPFGYRSLVKYNMVTGSVEHCVDFSKTILRNDAALFHNYVWVDDTHIALSCFYSNHVVIVDLEENEVEIKTVGKDGCRFSTILKHRDEYWLVVKNRLAFIKWNLETEVQEEYTVFPPGCEIANDKHCFDDSTAFVSGDYLYCFPVSCNMAVKFHLLAYKTEEIKSITEFCRDERLGIDSNIFDGGVRLNDKVILHYRLNSILIFDLNTEEVHVCEKKVKDAKSMKQMEKDNLLSFFEISHGEIENNALGSDQKVGKTVYDTVSKAICTVWK